LNASDILKILDDIAATSSRNEKEEILAKFIDDPFFKEVLSISYDPFITWGITPPMVESDGRADFNHETASVWALLHGLKTRSITGGEASQLVLETLQRLSPAASALLWRILSKDLRCGISTSTINKVLPGTVPVFDVMLAHLFEEKRIKNWPAIAEPKLDGVRVICLVKDGAAQFFSRSGKPFPAVDHLGPKVVAMVEAAFKAPSEFAAAWFSGTPRLALDGEITTGNFNKSSGDVRRKSETATDAVYSIFDAVPYDVLTAVETKRFDVPYKNRRNFVHWLVQQQTDPALKKLPSYFVNSADEAREFYQRFRDDGLEGAIKPLDAPYEKRRSYGWLKLKAEETEDLRVIGWFEGEAGKKFEGKFGGFLVERDHAGVPIEVNVGSGFSDDLREELLPIMRSLSAGQEPYTDKGKIKRRLNKPWRLVEVEYHEVTPDGSLRHPRFTRFRDDKDMSERDAA
jgi:DNA ligase 1